MTKAQQLYLYPDARLAHCSWLMVEQGERLAIQSGTMADFVDWAGQQPALQGAGLVVFMPVEAALHTVVTVPRKQRRFLARSLPFILEAQTAQDIEELHIVPGTQLPNEQVSVYAIPHRRMEQVLKLGTQLGLQLQQVVLDTQVLAGREQDKLHLAWHEDRILVSGLGRGMACARPDVSAWLERLLPEYEDTVAFAVTVGPEHEQEAATLVAELSQTFTVSDPARVSAPEWLGMLVDLWLTRSGWHNLLTGPYEPRHKGPNFRRYWPSLVSAAGFLVAALGLFTIADLRQTERRAEATWAAAESVFTQAMPSGMAFQRHQYRDTAETLLQSATVAGNGVSPFMALLADIDAAMREQGITLEEIRYTRDRNEIQMQVVGGSTAVLENFRDELESRTMSVTYSANRLDTGFRGSYRVQAGTGS